MSEVHGQKMNNRTNEMLSATNKCSKKKKGRRLVPLVQGHTAPNRCEAGPGTQLSDSGRPLGTHVVLLLKEAHLSFQHGFLGELKWIVTLIHFM